MEVETPAKQVRSSRPQFKKLQRLQAIEYLAAGWTKSATAKKVGVSLQSIVRWSADPVIKQEIESKINQTVSEQAGQLRLLIDPAIQLYARGVKGEKLSIANRQCAYDILRSFGILRDPEQSIHTAEDIVIEFGTVPPPSPLGDIK
jgi:hypothetical protein